MSSDPLWITEADVVAMMDMAGAIRALEAGLEVEALGGAVNMTKTHVEWDVAAGHATLHAIGAAFAGRGIVGTKTWSHTPGGAMPLLILFDSATGALRAIIEAFAMGQYRTGAASGVATDRLATPDADELAIVGTGKQAITQVAAVAAVRKLRRVRVFGRNEARRTAFVQRIEKDLGLRAESMSSVADTVGGAPIVTLVTRAREPFLEPAMLARGAHVNAVGAIVPAAAEVARGVFDRCARVVVDTVPTAQRLSRELMDAFGQSDDPRWARVQSLASLVGSNERRGDADDLTLFKSLGMGVSDLALGIELHERARQEGRGRPMPLPGRVAPRLRS